MPQISYFPTQRSSETDRNKHVLYGVFRSQSNKKHKQKNHKPGGGGNYSPHGTEIFKLW